MPLTPSRLLATGAVCLLTAGLTVRPAMAQAGYVAESEIPPGDSLALQVQALFAKGQHLKSLELLAPHMGHAPADYTAWSMAARAALVLGYAVADTNPDAAKAWLHRAINYGQQAQALDSAGENGRYVTMSAQGQLALIESPIEKARLAHQVYQEALALLAIDSLHAGAHDVLGRIYLEVARLSGFQKFLGRAWLGGDLIHRATWDSAETHLRRAVQLQPGRNFYWLDLGTLLMARDRLDEARGVLDTMLTVPLETPQQEGFRRQARALLREIDARQGRGTVPDSTRGNR